MSLFLMSLLGGGGRGSKQIKPMSLYILFFFNDGFPKTVNYTPARVDKELEKFFSRVTYPPF